MLDRQQTDTITEDQARWFMQAVHQDLFSKRRWEKFLRSRAVPGSGVTFPEIEVDLCNVASKEQILQEEYEEKREKEERAKRKLEKEMAEAEERERFIQRLEEANRKRLEVEKRRQEDEERRRNEEEMAMLKKKQEKEAEQERILRLKEEEERGAKEAAERENLVREKEEEEERERKRKALEELEEIRRLKDLQEKQMKEEEERRLREEQEGNEAEVKAIEAMSSEQKAQEDLRLAQEEIRNAKDAKSRKEAEDKEKAARARATENNHKRIRYELKVAIKSRDREKLTKSVGEFKKAQLPDDEGDLFKAERLLKQFKAKEKLLSAMDRRVLQDLEKAVDNVKKNGFEPALTNEMIEANKLLLQLRRLERIRAEILELKQTTVAEIRSYQKPPVAVHTVMIGTFFLLGHKEKETKVWKAVQALVGKTGKESLKRRCLGLDASKLDINIARKAKMYFTQFDLEQVRDVSAGAATFYVWGTSMIEEAESRAEIKANQKSNENSK
ncbi:uncharacterized protein LOC141899249 isoform X2 [Tubulanus polymorphus]